MKSDKNIMMKNPEALFVFDTLEFGFVKGLMREARENRQLDAADRSFANRVYERMDSYENGEQDDELPRSNALVVLDILELSLFMELCRDLRDDEAESEFARLTAERLYSDSVEVLSST